LTGDPGLAEAFHSGEDIHRYTASQIFGVLPELVSGEMRQRAKAVNFGILYGMSESRLAREQGLTRAEAKRFVETYFTRYSSVRDYIARVRDQARRDGAVRTAFGRVRQFPQLLGSPGRVAEEQALRAAVNTTIQGTAADLMKLAMLAVDEALTRSGEPARILLQVHDELLIEVREERTEAVAGLVRQAMEQVRPFAVPLAVDQKTGRNWSEAS
jgi:DNA polymerase-1